MKQFENREVRLFISSTFRGMGKEREVLVRQVFPEIRRHCSERGIGFTEVDLRWGITSEEVDKGLATPICFQQIDNCQPFFIGLLGEYYGSTILPDQRDTSCADHPWIKKGDPAKKGFFQAVWQYFFGRGYLDRSITELEMLYALFNVGQNRSDEKRQAFRDKALFYFRDPHYAETLPKKERDAYIETDAAKRAKQQDLKQRLRDHGCHITEYQKPIDLKKLVLARLKEKINQKFPEITQEEQADFKHDAFAASRQKVYIKRQAYFDRLSQHAESDDAPLIIHGESGSGKTALLANWAAKYQETHTDEFVFWHFCGSSAGSTNPIELLQRIMLNLKSFFKWEENIPVIHEAIRAEFGEWLAKATKPVILIIDGLNQLEETEMTRGWLHYIPAKTRLFLSTISTEELPADWQRLELALLTEESERKNLITEYLNQYGKTLAEKPMKALLKHPQTANPLYLQIILEELRIFGEFDKLEVHLQGYLQAKTQTIWEKVHQCLNLKGCFQAKTQTIPDLYEKVLARLEADYEQERPDLVKDTCCLLWAARNGLEEDELLAILDIQAKATSSPLYFALQNALVSRAGVLTFFHDYLRQAVEKRYLSSGENQQSWHLRLANYFEKQEINARVATELPWQLEQAGEKERLRNCISDIPMFLQFDKDNKEYELWGYWLGLEPDKTMVGAYQESLARYEETEKTTEKDLGYVLNNLGMFFDKAGYFDLAIPLLDYALAITEKIFNEHPNTATSMNNLALSYKAKGDYDSAKLLYIRALAIKEKVLGRDHPSTATSLNNLASVLQSQGDFKSAEPLYISALAIREKVLGKDHPSTATSLNNLAHLYYAKGDYKLAEPLYKDALKIFEKILGKDHPSTATSLNNLALLLNNKGDYKLAEPLYIRALAIQEKVLGKDHPSTATSLNNLALLYKNKGDYKLAEPLYIRALAIKEKVLGKVHPGTMMSLGNLAGLYYAKGDYDSAEPLYIRALAISEKVLGKQHPDTAISLNNLAGLLEAKGDYDSAEPLYIRALAINEKVLGKEEPDTATSLNNLALLHQAKGEYDEAEPLFKRALAISEKVWGKEHPYIATYLNNLAGVSYLRGDYDSAKSFYQRTLAIREKVLGKEHPDTAISYGNLAGFYYETGDYWSAEPLLQSVIEISEKVLGAKHPNTISYRKNLEDCREIMG